MPHKIDVAPIREQGVEFAVVAVDAAALDDRHAQAAVASLVRPHLGPVHLVFMAQDSRGEPMYVGRDDIVDFLAEEVLVEDLPWHTLTLETT